MKSLKQYLLESKTEYRFRVKLSFKPESKQLEHMKSSLEGLGLADFGSVKSQPVMRDCKDFPNLGAVEPHSFDLVFEYPVTAEKIAEIFERDCAVKPSHMVVYNSLQSRDREDSENAFERPEKPEAQLLKPYEEVKQAELFGDKYNESLLKELSSQSSKKQSSVKTTNDIPAGSLSPVGSTRVSKPNPRKMR
jgi:hypothetical protein